MKKFKLMTTFFCAVIAIAMAFSAMVTISANAEEDTRQLIKLDAYEDAVIPNGYEHNDEYSKYDTDASKRLDVGLRAPGNGGYMDGDPLTNPGAPYGNGVNVAQGIAKYKIKYGGGAVRLRYGYTVDLSDTNINLRILSTDGVNGHLNLTFSNDYMAVSHDALAFNGFVLDIYKDNATTFQSAIISASHRSPIDGINQTVFNYTVSDDDPESFCFSVYTYIVDGQYHVKVMNKNNTGEYILPASLNEQVVREDGTTNIGINCFYDWNDNGTCYTTFVMQVKDPIRTAYETATVEPLKAQLTAYSAEAINAAEITDIAAVDAFVAKKAAIDGNLVAKLRVSDRDLLKVNEHVAAADAALKAKAGALVKNYLDGEVTAMSTAFAKALSDTEYKTVTAESEINSLKELYNSVNGKVNTTYASLASYTEEEKAVWTGALTSAANAIARLEVNKAVYDGEQLPLTTAEELVAAKAKHAELAGEAFQSRIAALATTDAIKADLQTRIVALGTKITEAEQNLNKADVINGQIKNYEDAPITTVAEIRAALELKALIDDYTGLDEEATFTARIEAKDTAIQNAAYALLEERFDTLKQLTEAGLKKNSEKKALESAINAITDTDLLSEEKQTLVSAALTNARNTVKEFNDKLEELNWVLASQGGAAADTADIELLEKGVRFKNGGNGDQLISTKKVNFGENDVVMVKFSVKALAYLNGDGKARGSNNTWIFLCDRLQNGGSYVNRTSPNSISLMIWNCVESSFVKSYSTEFGDAERDQTNISTFTEDDGSYVIVTFRRAEAKNRFEIVTTIYSANGEEVDSSLNIISYTENFNGATFDNGVYVGFSAWADENNKFFNEWDIEFVGNEADYDKQPDTSEDSGSGSSSGETPSDSSNSDGSEEDGGCFGAIGGASCAFIALAGIAAIIRKKKQN